MSVGATVRAVPPRSVPLVTLHLFTVDTARVPQALARMALDRRHLRATPGCRFWKLLGTGRGRTFTPRDVDLHRWGLLVSWDTPADLVAFERRSPVAAAWRDLARERWRVDLLPVRARGTWAGARPFEPVTTQRTGTAAAITRARLAPARAGSFWRAVPPVSADLRRAAGLRFAVGIGEAPLGLQGTFSVWEDSEALHDYAYRRAPHRVAIARTATEAWYAEECFARFSVLQSTGTVDATDPAATGPLRT